MYHTTITNKKNLILRKLVIISRQSVTCLWPRDDYK